MTAIAIDAPTSLREGTPATPDDLTAFADAVVSAGTGVTQGLLDHNSRPVTREAHLAADGEHRVEFEVNRYVSMAVDFAVSPEIAGQYLVHHDRRGVTLCGTDGTPFIAYRLPQDVPGTIDDAR